MDQLVALNQSSITLPHGESELDHIDIQLTSFEGARLPRISSCPLAYACKRHEIQEIGNSHQALIFGEVTNIYIDDSMYEKNESGRLKVDAKQVNPVLRLGAGEYGTLGEVISMKRPA